MDERASTWHLADEAVYDYADRALSPAAMTEARRHVLRCPECARRVRQAKLLFACLQKADTPRLERDLAPRVVAGLQAARASHVRWRWVLAAQALGAAVTLAAFGFHLDRWFNELLIAPQYQALREYGLRLIAEGSALIAPFLEFIPAFPSRLAPIRLSLPHLEGPVLGWLGLAAAAVVLGLVGNAVLLRSADGIVPHAGRDAKSRSTRSGRTGKGLWGGRA